MDTENDNKYSGVYGKPSCFGPNLERNRKHETEVEIPTPHISWRQKLIDQQVPLNVITSGSHILITLTE